MGCVNSSGKGREGSPEEEYMPGGVDVSEGLQIQYWKEKYETQLLETQQEKRVLEEEVQYLKEEYELKSRHFEEYKISQHSEIKDLQCKNTVLEDSNMQLKHDIMVLKEEHEKQSRMNDYEKIFLEEEINYLKDAEQSRDEQRVQDIAIEDLQNNNKVLKDSKVELERYFMVQKEEYELQIKLLEEVLEFQDVDIKELQYENTFLKDSNMQLKHDIMVLKDEYEIKIRGFEDQLSYLYNEKKNLQNEKYVNSTIPHPQQILQDNNKVLLRDFNFVKKLGEGAFGKVVLATGSLPGQPERLYAIKAMDKRRITSSAIPSIFVEREALMSTSLHPFVTTLYSCFQNKDHLFFVLEYVSGGDLRQQLTEVKVFCEKKVKFYSAEISVGLQCLHQCGILHRDLKLENVLVGRDGHCKISDFGLSKMGVFKHDRASSHCGTPVYMAPEMWIGLPYGHAVDWWALGIMIYEMLTGCLPFGFNSKSGQDNDNGSDDEGGEGDYDEEEEKLCYNIIKSEVQYPQDMSPDAVSLVMKLLRKNPEDRLGADGTTNTFRAHPFFKCIDWKALEEKKVNPPEEEKLGTPEDTFREVFVAEGKQPAGNSDAFKGFSFIHMV